MKAYAENTGFYLCPKCRNPIASSSEEDLKIFCSSCRSVVLKIEGISISKSKFINIIKFNQINNINKNDA